MASSRSRLLRSRSGFLPGLLCVLVSAYAAGEPQNLNLEEGSRQLDPPGVPEPLVDPDRSASTPLTTRATAAAKSPSHKVGPKPKTPAATVPADVPLPSPSERARRGIALGPTREQLASEASPELSELRAADKVLFPEPLPGLTAGWSFSVSAGGSAPVGALGLPPHPRTSRDSDVLPEDSEWLRSLTMPDLPVVLDRRVVTYLKFYKDSPRGRTIAAIWAQKSGRYIAAMKAAFRRAGLPSDLVWLSMIESGHDPTIASPAGAVGLWQFMPESARMYGLLVDQWVDERRDPGRSTQAAIRFLGDLHARFGSWDLALGAYNMGYAGMSRSIAKYSTNDFWTLSRLEGGLPWETTLYVPKIYALAIVMNNRQAFGLGRVKPEPAVGFDTILVPPGTTLAKVASFTKASESELLALNPHYLAGRVPPAPSDAPARTFPVKVPVGRGQGAAAALSGSSTRTAIVVRVGDRLPNLAQRYGVTPQRLAAENGLSQEVVLAPRTALLMPTGAHDVGHDQPAGPLVVSRPAQAGPGERIVFYEVAAGDDVAGLAAAFGISETELVRDSAIDPAARLAEGMVLQVVVGKDEDLSHVRHFELQDLPEAAVLVAGSPAFAEHFEGIKGKRRVEVLAKPGDTLAGIGKRHGMTVGSMERVNQRSRTSPVVVGERVVVYTDRAAGSAPTLAPEPLPALAAPRPDLLPSAISSALIPAAESVSP
jgi:membrane-bound lytic murein transglycosylase D